MEIFHVAELDLILVCTHFLRYRIIIFGSLATFHLLFDMKIEFAVATELREMGIRLHYTSKL